MRMVTNNENMTDKTKRCPYCGEEILAIAKKCKHCGEWLEAKVPEREKKPCPVCGESVDADIEVCPYCKELTHFNDSHQDSIVFSQDYGSHRLSEDGSCIYCKNCKTSLSVDAESCPNCGDKDPFYFRRMKRIESIATWGGMVIVFALEYIAVEYMGLTINVKPEWLGIVCFMIAWFILCGIFSILIKRLLFQSTIKDYEGTMQRLFNDIGNPAAIERWRTKVKEIL